MKVTMMGSGKNRLVSAQVSILTKEFKLNQKTMKN